MHHFLPDGRHTRERTSRLHHGRSLSRQERGSEDSRGSRIRSGIFDNLSRDFQAFFYASTHKLLLRRHQKPKASPSPTRNQRLNSARPRSGVRELVLPRVRVLFRPEWNPGSQDYWSDVLPRGSMLRMSNSG
ncbi:hypothetical protein DY000_02007580 [Brassica cretica]|uniref:Uncharacterized protein n=1 Tax=Brassica cretica TaxID=69181 RepID=A0ABQ7BW50_BRACR|nr:hypothetical protein DY000_02007580 [Brassica cretica]